MPVASVACSEDVIVFSRKETWSSNRVKVYSKVDLGFARYGFYDVLSSLGEFVVRDKMRCCQANCLEALVCTNCMA